jgi:hypothetical protein
MALLQLTLVSIKPHKFLVAKVTQVTMVTKICKHTTLYGTLAIDASVDQTPQVSSSAILFLPMEGNFKVRF